MRLTTLFVLLAAPAFAGDTVEGPSLVELLVPTVFEVEDFGELLLRNTPDYWAARGIDDAELIRLVFDGPDIKTPAPVPAPASITLLAGAMVAFGALKRRKAWK